MKFIYRLLWLDWLFPCWRIRDIADCQCLMIDKQTQESSVENKIIITESTLGGRHRYTVSDIDGGGWRRLRPREAQALEQLRKATGREI